MRLYVVTHDDKTWLVDAATAADAIQYCAKPKYVATPAKTRDVAELMSRGVMVEQAVTVTHT